MDLARQSAEGNATGILSQSSQLNERGLAWFVFLGLSAMFIVSIVWRAPDEPVLIICPFRFATGLLCPGCGMTRAFCALGHGELLRAIHFNALSPFLYVALIVVWLGAAATLFNFPRVRAAVLRLRPNFAVSIVILGAVMVWWVVRLVSGY